MNITLVASIENAALAREAVAEFMNRHNLSKEDHFATLSACGEAIINCCEHAYKDLPIGPISIRGFLQLNVMVIEIEDVGTWIKTVKIVDDPFAERGRGILLMNRQADEVAICSNILTRGTVVRLTKIVSKFEVPCTQSGAMVAA
jgi:anti-sigma regulatory factor (Ser/Thr protein kinase)